MMNKIKTADAIIEGLENSGIKYIFGVPGEENLDVLEAIRKSKIIKFILTRHEQEAGFMAATIGRLTGIPGVALSTSWCNKSSDCCCIRTIRGHAITNAHWSKAN